MKEYERCYLKLRYSDRLDMVVKGKREERTIIPRFGDWKNRINVYNG